MIAFLKYQIYRIINPSLYRRMRLAKSIESLANIIRERKQCPVTIDGDGNAYLIMPDGIKLFYNTQLENGTFGDGQSLNDYGTPSTYFKDATAAENVIFDYLKKGASYIDVGANSGYFYALKIAKFIKKSQIICFEPDPYILPHLQKNILENNADNIEVIQKAVSNKKGYFYLKKGLGASGYLVNDKPQDIENYFKINTVTLDQFVKTKAIESIDLIKIDIEGGEFNFLKGANKTLQKIKPALLIELRDELLKRSGTSFDEVQNYLESHNYTLYKSHYNDDYFAIQKHHKITAVLKRERFKKI